MTDIPIQKSSTWYSIKMLSYFVTPLTCSSGYKSIFGPPALVSG